ncbi:MAG: Multiple resistance and pH regulation protein F [Caldanaerobacter subterraneus]|jgi:multicomponent Na+:H+ antiporter subunit F|uniref:Multiple resistance and pH regulation protein F n=2 Tax=Thermoanaerobacteraceae TaxID=186814 RepID=E8UVB3_THEBF|nr:MULTISPECIES: monovalent cation/H+ antiporter complex subunit F [Thermoanaerobacteraceae]KUJ91779.1 MAG: multiple resistance and pH regulation protein F [Thermoanaerobacter thermocopriae]MDK2986640.1 multicomponent Na+:H+ antiporter subunit [Clostridia bacterium]ADV79056.1 multiple resistance and pH regulation protein F [Thermoanaerobacter brockii subsp. finnii Ako-1]KUK08532.1 MAG: Multiple resistance and pH regulation protein F [Caldanaerobacter subterraneus]KUK35635.1 MAG: Multiple resis
MEMEILKTLGGIILCITIIISILASINRKGVLEKVVITNIVNTKTVALIFILSYIRNKPVFLDVAVVYALINFIAAIAVSKFFDGYHKQGD